MNCANDLGRLSRSFKLFLSQNKQFPGEDGPPCVTAGDANKFNEADDAFFHRILINRHRVLQLILRASVVIGYYIYNIILKLGDMTLADHLLYM